jgi:hypothetical protein
MTDAVPDLPTEAMALLRARDRHACLDADTLVALARGALGPARREHLLTEVARCGDCARALQFAIDAESVAESLADSLQPLIGRSRQSVDAFGAPKNGARPGRRWLRSLGMAAGLLASVGLGLALLRPLPEDVLRGEPGHALEPPDGALMSAAPARLAWHCDPAQPALVELRDASAALVWQGQSARCSVDLPPGLKLGAGLWLWQVRSPDGRLLAGPFQLRIE